MAVRSAMAMAEMMHVHAAPGRQGAVHRMEAAAGCVVVAE
jgi:hypothetical protein